MCAVLATAFTYALPAHAILPTEVRWHNESSDTTKITDILIKVTNAHPTTPNETVALIAKEFIGTPYVAGTLEGRPKC